FGVQGRLREFLQRGTGLPEDAYLTGRDDGVGENRDVPSRCPNSPASFRRESNRADPALAADRQTKSLNSRRRKRTPPQRKHVVDRDTERFENSRSREINNMLQVDLSEGRHPWLGGGAKANESATILKICDV